MQLEKETVIALNNRRLKLVLSWLLVILWMAFIFHMSAQPAHQSDKLSTGIAEKVVKTIEKAHLSTTLSKEETNHIVRKIAHFSIYLVLALLVINALTNSGVRGWKRIGLTLAICVLYAMSTERMPVYYWQKASSQATKTSLWTPGYSFSICRRQIPPIIDKAP